MSGEYFAREYIDRFPPGQWDVAFADGESVPPVAGLGPLAAMDDESVKIHREGITLKNG